MRSISANHPARFAPALRSFADECSALMARLIAYVGALALIAIAALGLWDRLAFQATADSAAGTGWAPGYPAFAGSRFDMPGKTEAYEILRHPDGGRKDAARRAAQGEKPIAGVDIDWVTGARNPRLRGSL